jgi:hypothetical protein
MSEPKGFGQSKKTDETLSDEPRQNVNRTNQMSTIAAGRKDLDASLAATEKISSKTIKNNMTSAASTAARLLEKNAVPSAKAARRPATPKAYLTSGTAAIEARINVHAADTLGSIDEWESAGRVFTGSLMHPSLPRFFTLSIIFLDGFFIASNREAWAAANDGEAGSVWLTKRRDWTSLDLQRPLLKSNPYRAGLSEKVRSKAAPLPVLWTVD